MVLFDPDFSELSSEQLAEIDRICGEYERLRIDGHAHSIEHFVEPFRASAPGRVRSMLVKELIRIDIEISLEWDEPIDIADYVARFPEHAEFVQEVIRNANCRTHYTSDSPWSLDTPRAQQGSMETPVERVSFLDNIAPSGATHPDASDAVNARTRFQIVRNLASGGIGTVYVGLDRDLDREVAIKVLKRKFASDPRVLARFRTEATITSHLEHPNIVPVYAIGIRSDGLPFYAMRLVRGRSLLQAINEIHAASAGANSLALDFRRTPACRDLLMRFITACRAAAFAHSRGIVHRDIKPSNIMVDDFGETLLVDWGLAMRVAPTHDATTAEDQKVHIVGTPGYMSPEQAVGFSESVDHRSDIYSLGATLVTLLTKQIPRSQLISGNHSGSHTGNDIGAGTSPSTKVALHAGNRIQHATGDDWLKAFRLPPELQAIIEKSLRKEPTDRYASAEHLADDLESWLADEPVSVVRDSVPVKLRRWMKDHPAITGAVLAGAACVAIAMSLGMLMLASQNESLRQANEREQTASKAAQENATRAESNAAEAVKQRARVLSVLDRFLVDIERGLANVPGGAKVQRSVLFTVLNELDEISREFGYDGEADLSNAVALLDLATLFARVGVSDVKLDSKSVELGKGTPLEAAERLADEAWKVAEHVELDEHAEQDDTATLLSVRAQILERQADIYRQTGRGDLSLARLETAVQLRSELTALDPSSTTFAIGLIGTTDQIGQYYLLAKQFDRAAEIFADTHARATTLRKSVPDDLLVLRTVAIASSRLGDIANANGNLDEAERWLAEDKELTEYIFEADPNNALHKRDLTISLDRLGRTRENRGQLEQAIEAFEESRQLRMELLEAEPDDLQFIREIFISNFKLGAINMVLKRFEEAKRYYHQADELAQRMIAIDKSNVAARRFQSMCAESTCDILLSESKADEALPFALHSLQITQELAALAPHDGNIAQDVFVLHTKIAKVHKLRGDMEACLRQLETTLQTVEDEVASTDGSLQSLDNLSSVLVRLGDAYFQVNRHDDVVACIERMLKNESKITDQRQDADSRRLLTNANMLLGQALMELQKPIEARRALEAAKIVAEKMISEGMRVTQMESDLSTIEQLLVTCQEQIVNDQ